ncbi:hypothetical protein EON63_12295 [archaeon]|nr:MAG: hypothetical protein EON63_12295 [archaeon]
MHGFPVLTGSLGLFIAKRLSAFRYVRPYLDILIVAILVYRVYTVTDNVDLLQSLINELNTIAKHSGTVQKVLFLLKDMLAILLVLHIVRAVTDIHNTVTNFKGFVPLYKDLAQFGYNQVKSLSFVRSILQKETTKLESSLELEVKKKEKLQKINIMLSKYTIV